MSMTVAEEVAKRERELLGEGSKTYDAIGALDLDFVRDCFNANERGDGLLLAALYLDKYLYVLDGQVHLCVFGMGSRDPPQN